MDFSPKLEDFVRIVVLSVRNNYPFVRPVLLAVLIYLEIDTIYREETDSKNRKDTARAFACAASRADGELPS